MKKLKFLPLESQVQKTISKYGMLSRGEKVLVAVSGGADSMALLHCLHRLAPPWQLTLAVAHLNHRLRGEESDHDEAFVREACTTLELPFCSEVVDVGERAAAAKRNLEETAREIRYEFLRRTAARLAAQKIAAGHTLDDQAETVLMRFLRGSGTAGLSAIHPIVDSLLIRPLLECSRANIMEYLKIRGIAYREDASNLDLKYQRNRVRRELIPYLEKNFNPRLADTLAKEAELARDVAGYLEAQAKIALESSRVSSAEGLVLPVQRILELHPALQKSVARLALRECRGNLRGIAAHHIEDILALCRPLHSGRRIKLPGGPIVARQFGSILFVKDEPATQPGFSYRLTIPGRCLVPEADLEFSTILVESGTTADGPSESGPFRALLEADSLPAELTIRSRRPGDRYGGPRHRKVKKMLIDAKVPLYARGRLPVVVAGDVVIWIPGFKPAKAYIAQPHSGRSVVIEAYEKTTR